MCRDITGFKQGRTIWITGLSGAGKTTLGTKVVDQLKSIGKCVVFLDGDELREVFGAVSNNGVHYGKEGRINLAMRYARLCQMLSSQDVTVVIATISLFKEVHLWNRQHLPGYFEVYLKVPMEELRRRDPKGIYRRYDRGEVTHVAGLDLKIDEPEAADLVLPFSPQKSVMILADELLLKIQEDNS